MCMQFAPSSVLAPGSKARSPECSVLVTSSDALVTSSFLFLVAMPGAPSSVLAVVILLLRSLLVRGLGRRRRRTLTRVMRAARPCTRGQWSQAGLGPRGSRRAVTVRVTQFRPKGEVFGRPTNQTPRWPPRWAERQSTDFAHPLDGSTSIDYPLRWLIRGV